MKKGVLLGFTMLLFLGTAFVSAENRVNSVSFSEPILTPSLEFTAEYDSQKNHVIMNWETWGQDLMWYKLVRSQEDPNPSYPDDGYIYYSTDPTDTSYTDKSPPKGNVFYRICAITFQKEVYCSQVQKINTENVTNVTENKPVFCIQVITPAVDSVSGECKEFPTPCDVPDGWEVVDTCPIEECEEADFYAIDPESGECLEYSSSCDVPKNFIPVESCEEEVCEETPVIVIEFSTGQCQKFTSSCDVPEGWEQQNDITSCEDVGKITLSVERAEEAAFLQWTFTGNIETIGGFEILKSSDGQKPTYPEDTIEFVGRTDDFVFVDKNIESGTGYRYAVCAVNSDDRCFPMSEEVLFVYEPTPEKEFLDVSEETEMGEAIMYYAENEVVSGFEDGTFRPEKQVTRAEMAKMATLANSISPNIPKQQIFCDVPIDEWFTPFIHYFSENGYASGFEGGGCDLNRFFSPHNPVLRGEAIKMIFEILEIEIPEFPAEDDTGFTDVSAESWLAPYAKKALQTEVFTGFEDGSFHPDEPATRGEIMLYLRRAQEL